MRHRAVFVAVALTASVIGAFSGMSLGLASRAAACPREDGRSLEGATAVRRGAGLEAVVGGRSIVTIGANGRREAFDVGLTGDDVIRHVSARPGSGTAFVLDRRGADVVVVVTGR